jgi:hypothetical protein
MSLITEPSQEVLSQVQQMIAKAEMLPPCRAKVILLQGLHSAEFWATKDAEPDQVA